MNEDKKCDHKWRKIGLWDGQTSDGKATGGQLYGCDICNIHAQSLEEVNSKGGTLIEGTDIYGKPMA